MANDNVLEGMRCPSCGSEEPFHILTAVMLTVHDSGTEMSKHSVAEWEDDSYAMCDSCDWEGTAGDLYVVNSRYHTSERN